MNKIIKKIAWVFQSWRPACFILMALLAASCTEEPIGQQPVDGKRPNPLLRVEAVGRPGGAYIFYQLPRTDMDISYVKGEFEIDGIKQTVRASVYNNYLRIDGLDSHLYVEIDLYVVDHSENMSEPLRTKFITFDAPYTTMGNSIKMTSSVGGIGVRWESQNAQYQYYANMGYLSSSYDSDIGVVLLVADDDGKMNELAVSFSPRCSFLQPVLDSTERLYGAYAMDKWGHYSDTVFAMLKPVYEQWLNRRNMKAYYIGTDNPTLGVPQVNHPLGYYSPMSKLFDSIAYCFQPYNNSYTSSNTFETGDVNPETGETYTKPFYFTMDLGVTADISRFWIALPSHSDLDRYYEFSNGSIYDFQLWGTETDFGENSRDYVPANDPYWSDSEAEGTWKRDPRWKPMGRYYNKRPNVTGDTPGNYTTEPPARAPGASASNKEGLEPDWDKDKRTRGMGNGVRYLADGSGPVKNDNFYFPDASVHFAITQAAVGPVRYVRWQINEVWQQLNHVRMTEVWYWGGIVEDNK
jgi:hypothetical protein